MEGTGATVKEQTAAQALSALLKANPDLSVNGTVSAVVEESDPLEHAEQCAVIDWARAHEDVYPALRLLYAVPNGGYRHPATGAALVREGVRSGIPDLCLPVARRGFHSMYIEMKRIGGRPSSAQLYIIEQLREFGNMAVVCYGAGEAIRALEHYLAE